jgi:hypothetical protein
MKSVTHHDRRSRAGHRRAGHLFRRLRIHHLANEPTGRLAMKIRGVALDTYQGQVDGGDTEPVHPDVIKIINQRVPVTLAHETRLRIGTTTRLWRENGQIMFDVPVDAEVLMRMFLADTPENARVRLRDLSTASIAYTLEVKDSEGRAIKGGTIYEVALIQPDHNMNHNAPTWNYVDDEK